MKKGLLLLMLACLPSMILLAQDEPEEEAEEKGFKKENLFTGGSISLGFSSGQTVLGANPVFGYKLADWIDAGLAFNYVYNGARDYQQFDDKIRQTVLGPGVFTRLYPVKFLFVQGQFERNFSTTKYFPPGAGDPSEKYKSKANSLLLGAGFAQGRQKGSSDFFYISLLFDVLKNVNSPYVDVDYDPNNPSADPRIKMTPILRAGVNVGLFQGRYR